jgi:hypothetical protein
MHEGEVIVVSLYGGDIIDEFKTHYYREPTKEEYALIKYYAQDKWDTHWITESLTESVYDTILLLEEKGEFPKLPPKRRDIIKAVAHFTKLAEDRKDIGITSDDDLNIKIYFASINALKNLEEKYGIRYDRERVQN